MVAFNNSYNYLLQQGILGLRTLSSTESQMVMLNLYCNLHADTSGIHAISLSRVLYKTLHLHYNRTKEL